MRTRKRILIGVSIDAVATAALPELFAGANADVTVVSPAGLAITASRYVQHHVAAGRSPAEVREAMESCLNTSPDCYDYVLAADEPLLLAFVDRPASPAIARLNPGLGDPSQLSRLLSKIEFSRRAEQAGLPVPAWRVLGSVGELTPETWDGIPFVIKEDRSMSGSGVHVVRSQADLDRARATVSQPFLMQQFVAGRVGASAVLYRNGEPACWFSYYLCRNWPNPEAAASAIEVCSAPELESMIRAIGTMTGFDGLCGIDWVMDPRSGKPLALEINPRPTPGMAAAAVAGVSFEEAVADMLEGVSRVQRPLERSGAFYRKFPQHLHWAIEAGRPWEFLRTFANARWRDPMLVCSQVRRVLTHYLPLSLRQSAKRLLRIPVAVSMPPARRDETRKAVAH